MPYFQVARPFTFQDADPTFSPTALSVGGAGPSPTASAGDAQSTPELTKNVTTTAKSTMPMDTKGINCILNLSLQTGLGDQCGFGSLTGVATKIWVPQQETLY